MYTDFLYPLLLLLLNTLIVASVAAPSDSSCVNFAPWFGDGGGGEDGASNSDPDLKGSYKALQAWKASVKEDPNGVLTNWVGPNVCSYNRVFCSEPPKAELSTSSSSSKGGRVVAVIDLNHANIKGTLVGELSLIPYLSALHLNSNRFYGSVPTTLADLEYLTELDLSNNMFTGSFPTSTLYIPNLVYLDLRFNRFVGRIPDELFEKDLDAIFLHNNMFDGYIPNRLWNSPASVVTLANNRFSGNLPETFGYMGYSSSSSSGLREVLFFNNKLTGCIPEGVGFLTNMEVLDFSFNSLTGHLPATISCLTEVEVLNLAHNQIIGVVSDVVCSLGKLVNLTISYNFFSSISSDCGSKQFLGFDFSGNCIDGRESQRPRHQCASLPIPVPGGGQLSCFTIPPTGPFSCITHMSVSSPVKISTTQASSKP